MHDGKRNTWNQLLGLYETYYIIEQFGRITDIETFICERKILLPIHHTRLATKYRLEYQQKQREKK